MKKFFMVFVCLMTMVMSASAQDDMYYRKKVSKEAKWQNDVAKERRLQNDIDNLKWSLKYEEEKIKAFITPIVGTWKCSGAASNGGDIIFKIGEKFITIIENGESAILELNDVYSYGSGEGKYTYLIKIPGVDTIRYKLALKYEIFDSSLAVIDIKSDVIGNGFRDKRYRVVKIL